MTSLRRGVIWALGSLAIVLVVADVVSWIANFRAAARAKMLLSEVRAMKLGTTTDADVQRIVQQYGGHVGGRTPLPACEEFAPRWRAYAIDVQSRVLNRIGEFDRFHNTKFRHFGATQWRVDASFGIDSEGRLTCVQYSVYSNPARSESLRLHTRYQLPYSRSDELTYSVGYSDIHFVQNLDALATTAAAPEQQRRVFDFDLSCLTRIGGCQRACEVMPSAWLDYQRREREEGEPVPANELTDPRCKKLE